MNQMSLPLFKSFRHMVKPASLSAPPPCASALTASEGHLDPVADILSHLEIFARINVMAERRLQK